MAKRLIDNVSGARIYRDAEWDEYVVHFTDGNTYHTDDLDDARGTARVVERENGAVNVAEVLA